MASSNSLDHESKRFTLELEFVQMLANPAYVQWLAQEGYFASPSFHRYLEYLLHWRHPDRARFLLYPSALTVLELLVTDPEFRAAAGGPGFLPYVNAQFAKAIGPNVESIRQG